VVIITIFRGSQRNKEDAEDEKDKVAKELILKAIRFKRHMKGARQIKMILVGVYNLKGIRRIMKKYSIICPIRKANPYRRIIKPA
jgi:putative transposase